MSSKKIIAVLGATGKQGSGLVRAILADPEGPFAVRALTRDPKSDKALELAAAGAEVVQADLDDEASIRDAFTGAYGAYVVTNFWEPRAEGEEDTAVARAAKELVQAETAAKVAAETDLQHVVWSTLDDSREFFGDDDTVPSFGDYKVPHLDAKAEANKLFTRYGVPTTFLNTTFYFEAFVTDLGPRRAEDGKLTLTLPMADAPLSSVAVEDIGRTAYGIFKQGAEFIGKNVGLAGEHLTGQQYAEALSAALGEEVVYRPMDLETFRSLPFLGADEGANSFEFLIRFADQIVARRDISVIRRLNPDLQSFTDWLAVNKDRISVA